MTEVRMWKRLYEDGSEAHSHNERLPQWLRAVEAARARAGDNNHAPFRRGELADILGSVDVATGAITPARDLVRVIALAVEFGYLAPGSFWRCLILPTEHVRRGDLTAEMTACPVKARHARVRSSKHAYSACFEERNTPTVRDSNRETRLQCVIPRSAPSVLNLSGSEGPSQATSSHEAATSQVGVTDEVPDPLPHGRVNPHTDTPAGAEPQTPFETQPQRETTPSRKLFVTHPERKVTGMTDQSETNDQSTPERVCSVCGKRKGSSVDPSGVCAPCRRVAAAAAVSS